MRFNCDTSIASSHYKTYNGTPRVLCREGRTVASVVDLGFQAPPLLEWGRVYVEEVREEEEETVVVVVRGGAGARRNQRSFFCPLGPRHMGSTRAEWVQTDGLPRTRTHADESAR